MSHHASEDTRLRALIARRQNEEVIRVQKKQKKILYDSHLKKTHVRGLIECSDFFILRVRQKGRRRKTSSQRAPLHTLSFYTRIKKRRKRKHAERATTNPPSVLARAHAAFERGFFAGRAEGNFTQSWISNVRFLFSFPVCLLFFISPRVVVCFFCARDADDLRLSLSLSLCARVRVSQIAGTSEVF